MAISQFPSASAGGGASLAGKFLSVSDSYSTGIASIDGSGSASKIAKKVLKPYNSFTDQLLPNVSSNASIPYYYKNGWSFYPIGDFSNEVYTPSFGGEICQYPTASFVFSVNHGKYDTAISNLTERKFVAVGNSGSYMTSKDGKSWTDRGYISAASYNTLYRIKYANGIFVAAGDNGTIVTSTDAQNWTSANVSGVYDTFQTEIHYENGKFWILANNAVLSSSDGTAWTKTTLAGVSAYPGYSDFAYGNGAYIITNRYNNNVYKSANGTSWTDIKSSFPTIQGNSISQPSFVGYGDGKFILGDANNYGVWTSTDGDTWTILQGTNLPNMNTSVRGMQYLDGKFIAHNPYNSMNVILQSADGIKWKKLGKYATSLYKYILKDGDIYYMREANVLFITTDISAPAESFGVMTYESKVVF